MQLIELVTLLYMAATTIAAPSVSIKRTDGGSTDACGQNQVLSCCTQGQSSVTPFQVVLNLMKSPNLPIVAPLLAQLNSEIQTGCTCHISTFLPIILPPEHDANDTDFQARLLSVESLALGNKPVV